MSHADLSLRLRSSAITISSWRIQDGRRERIKALPQTLFQTTFGCKMEKGSIGIRQNLTLKGVCTYTACSYSCLTTNNGNALPEFRFTSINKTKAKKAPEHGSKETLAFKNKQPKNKTWRVDAIISRLLKTVSRPLHESKKWWLSRKSGRLITSGLKRFTAGGWNKISDLKLRGKPRLADDESSPHSH